MTHHTGNFSLKMVMMYCENGVTTLVSGNCLKVFLIVQILSVILHFFFIYMILDT